MRTKTTTISLLLAGLLGAAGAWAESPNATSDTPVGGQASTMTQGRPNMATTNNPAVENPAPTGTMGATSPMASDASSPATMGAAPAVSKDSTSYSNSNSAVVEQPAATTSTVDNNTRVAPEVVGTHGKRAVQTASMTTGAYLGTGEASTMVNGQPNANPNDPVLTKDRAERRSEREFKRCAAEPWQQPGGTPE